MTFKELGLHESLLEGLDYAGFQTATPIQEQAIPAVIQGNDIIACAQTGTGKTGAFLLPTMDALIRNPQPGNAILILTPTRELALQIDMQIQGMGYFTNIHSSTVYGGGDGADFNREKEAFKSGLPIIVATPGKLLAHLNMGYVDFSTIRYLILDEADRMLDMGFIDDIDRIISHLPEKRQNLMFSATMAPKIRKLAHKILSNPTEINLAISKPAAGVTQRAFMCFDEQKLPLIDHIISQKTYESILVFCSRKAKVSEVVRLLKKRGYDAQGISSDLEQREREELLMKFRARQLAVLVATDVLSRGIDIQGIELVINFDVPNNAEDYVHRIGRTARADTKGEAVTLINPADKRKFKSIEELIERVLEKEPLPEAIGTAPDPNAAAPENRGGNNKRRNNSKNNDGSESAETPADRPKRPIKRIVRAVPATEETEQLTADALTADTEVAPETASEATAIPTDAPKKRRPQKRRPKKPVSTNDAETAVGAPESAAEGSEPAPANELTPEGDAALRPKRRKSRRKPRRPEQEAAAPTASEPTARIEKPAAPKTDRPAGDPNRPKRRPKGRDDQRTDGKTPQNRQERMNRGNDREKLFDAGNKKQSAQKEPAPKKKGLGGFIKKLFGLEP